MKNIFFLLSLFLAFSGLSQVEIKVIFKGVIEDTNGKAISSAGLYLLQNGATISSTSSNKTGGFILSASVVKKDPLVVQCSKPGYLNRNLLFDISDLAIPKKVLSLTIMLGENMSIQMFPINPLLSFTVGSNDFAEKFKWNEKQLECTNDAAYKKKYSDSLKLRVRKEEGRLLLEKFKTKSRELEQVQNYKLALKYIDTALTVQGTYALSDTSLNRRKQQITKNLNTQILAQKKQKSIDSLFHVGDSLLTLLKWQDAEKVYKMVTKFDPKSEKLKTKLASIATFKKEEDERKKELSAWAKNRAECTRLASGKKYNEAITAINKSKSLGKIPQILKDKIPSVVDSLNLLLKEQNLDNEVKKATDAAKKIKSDNTAMKSALDKITSLISNYKEIKKQTTSFSDLDKIITTYVDAEIKRAYDLQSKQDFDKAIQVYEQTKEILAFTHDFNTKQLKVSDIDQKVVAAQKAKEADIQSYNVAIKSVKNTLDSLTFDAKYGASFQPKAALGKIKTLLASNALKLKAKNPEVVALNNRYLKVKPYFENNAKVLKTMVNKDSTKSLNAANDFYAKAKAAEVGNLELAFLQTKIDSIKLKFKSSNANNSGNNVIGIIVSPPSGAKILTANSKNNSSLTSHERLNLLQQDALDKRSLAVERYNTSQTREYNETNRLQHNFTEQQTKTVVLMNEKISNQNKLNELKNRDFVENTNKQIIDKSIESQEINRKDKITQDRLRNRTDSINAHHQDRHNATSLEFQNFVDSVSVQRMKKDIESSEQNKLQDISQRSALNETNNTKLKQDHQTLEASKQSQRAHEKVMSYVDTKTQAPNYLKDEKGICYPWNCMTELKYVYEDEAGFETGKLIRRIVVGANGYGVIYDQVINANGTSSFSMNGQAISETIWLQDSNGTRFFEPGGPITPAKCP